jgi:ABC-type sugar transport system permease subunit
MLQRAVRVRTLLLFLAPFAILFGVFQLAPLVVALHTSLFNVALLRPQAAAYVGLRNYRTAFTDSDVLNAFRVTSYYTLAQVVLQVPLSLGLAVLVRRRFFGRNAVRAAVFSPVVTSTVIVSVLWLLLFDPVHGLLNAGAETVGIHGLQYLESSHQALPSLIVMSVWQNIGIDMVIYLGALQGIDPTLLEAASVDGAGSWSSFTKIVLPLLRRSTLVVVVITTVFSFQTFAPAYVMTNGGPDASTTFAVFLIYRVAFIIGDIGYASALSVLLVVFLLVVAAVQFFALRSRWDY